MPIKVEQLPGESIIITSTTEPFDPKKDVPAMFAEIARIRIATEETMALIIDVGGTNLESFSQLVVALSEASRAIKAGKEAGSGRPPITIFVGSGRLAELASQAMGQKQYGGVSGHLCTSTDDAIALARKTLASIKD